MIGSTEKFIGISMITDANEDCLKENSLFYNIALKYLKNLKDEYNNRLVANPDTSGRYHSDWLTMMYPRLKLARNLLTDDGVIFISIDDTEASNLKKICDEIYGSSNFLAQIIWERAFSPKNDAKFVSNSHDYVLMFAKNINNFVIGRLPRTEEANARYQNPDNDPRGVWKPSDMSVKTYNEADAYKRVYIFIHTRCSIPWALLRAKRGRGNYPPKSKTCKTITANAYSYDA